MYLQHTAVDVGVTGVSVGARQCQRASPDLSERPARTAAIKSITVLHHAGKEGAQPVVADAEIMGAEENLPVPFDRTNRQAGSVVRADIQAAITENLYPCRTATRIEKEQNPTAAELSPASVRD